MTDLIWLSKAQMRRIEPYFPMSRGVPRVDDRRIISGIIFVIRNGLRWRDAPVAYGPPKTIYNRFIRWSRLGVFDKIFVVPGSKGRQARSVDDRRHLSEGAPHGSQPARKSGAFRRFIVLVGGMRSAFPPYMTFSDFQYPVSGRRTRRLPGSASGAPAP